MKVLGVGGNLLASVVAIFAVLVTAWQATQPGVGARTVVVLQAGGPLDQAKNVAEGVQKAEEAVEAGESLLYKTRLVKKKPKDSVAKELSRTFKPPEDIVWTGTPKARKDFDEHLETNPSAVLVVRDGDGNCAYNLIANQLKGKDRVIYTELDDGDSFAMELSRKVKVAISSEATENEKLDTVARRTIEHVASPYGVRPAIVYIRLDQVQDKTTREKTLKDVQRFRTYGVNSVCTVVSVGKAYVKATRRLEVVVAK